MKSFQPNLEKEQCWKTLSGCLNVDDSLDDWGLYMLQLKIPPPVYFLIFGILMWVIAKKVFPDFIVLESPWNRIAFPFMLLALFIDGLALVQFIRKKTTINPLNPNNTHLLVTKGIYRFSRNPMYLGLLIWLLAWGLYLGNFLSLLFLPLFVYIITIQQIKPEEKILEEKFGQTYLDYQKRVRRWF